MAVILLNRFMCIYYRNAARGRPYPDRRDRIFVCCTRSDCRHAGMFGLRIGMHDALFRCGEIPVKEIQF